MEYTFIDENGIKLILPFIKNIDEAYFQPLIINNQLDNIKPLMGSLWYEEMKTQASTNSLTTANKTVLDDYITRLLAYYVYCDLIMEVSTQLENTGVRFKTSQNSDYADNEIIEKKRRYWESKISSLESEYKMYICNHSTDYPLYLLNNYSTTDTQPKLPNTKIYAL